MTRALVFILNAAAAPWSIEFQISIVFFAGIAIGILICGGPPM